jgi:hypothetical protein
MIRLMAEDISRRIEKYNTVTGRKKYPERSSTMTVRVYTYNRDTSIVYYFMYSRRSSFTTTLEGK